MKRSFGRSEDAAGGFQRVADIIVIAFVHMLACRAYGVPWESQMDSATAFAALVFMVTSEVAGLYRGWAWQPTGRSRTAALCWLVVPLVLTLLAFSSKTSANYSRVVSSLWFVLTPLGFYAWRLAARQLLHHLRGRGWNVKRVAFVGATPSAEQLARQINEQPWLGLQVLGVYDDRQVVRAPDRPALPRLGPIGKLVEACKAGEVDVVYVALPLRAERRIGAILRELADATATVYLLADFFTYDLLCARWSVFGDFPIVSIYDTPFRGIVGWLKRVEDLVLGFLILVLITIPLLVLALLVKLSSPGPVLFRQRRYGLNGKEIRVLKFRTMTVCEDGDRITQAKREDPRVTPLGRVMRRLSLDELPQFLQVLTGEMSIVGPRPHAVAHNEEYRALIQGYMLRHKVKPGITGWAQVNGWRGETPQVGMMAKRVQYDLEYIENWSLALDLEIIFLTVFGKAKRRGAY